MNVEVACVKTAFHDEALGIGRCFIGKIRYSTGVCRQAEAAVGKGRWDSEWFIGLHGTNPA